jgi:mitofusin
MFVDIIDLNYHILSRFGLGDYDKESQKEEEGAASALSTLGLGLGAITMVGGKTIGARGLLEGVVRLSELIGNESTRKWLAPLIGAATLGATVYFVLELPNTIPRTIGRRLKHSLAHPISTSRLQAAEGHTLTARTANLVELPFAQAHSARIARETRKVLRLAAWDLRERFRTVMEEHAKKVKTAEDSETRAMRAMAWFAEVAARTEEARVKGGLSEEPTASSA